MLKYTAIILRKLLLLTLHLRLVRSKQFPDLVLKLANGPSVPDDQVTELLLGCRFLDAEKYFCMSYAQKSDFEVMLNLCRKTEKTEIIGHRSAFLPYPVSHLLLRQAAFLDESLIAEIHFNRIEILPLDVLHDSHF